MKFHHFGVACSDIPETLSQLKRVFVVKEATEIIHDPDQEADLCMVYVEGSPPLELIAGPVVRNYVKKGIMLYHTCWEVDEIESVLARWRNEGCMIISEPKKAVLFGNRRVAFLRSSIGLVELLEKTE